MRGELHLAGDRRWQWTDMDPALSPAMVTRSGSPPVETVASIADRDQLAE